MATARQTPVGRFLDDGYSTKIAFASDPDISFWEKEVTPPALEGGDAIDVTTMFNATYRTFAPRSLITLDEVVTTVAWEPAVYSQILAIINVNDQITVHFPDGDTIEFWGFLRRFEPQSMVEGGHPEATITIVPTNRTSGYVEAGPTITATTGTA